MAIPESVRLARAKAAESAAMDEDDDEEKPEIPRRARRPGRVTYPKLAERRTERDIEAEHGGPGVYSCDHRKYYKLEEDEWKWDTIPEIMEGEGEGEGSLWGQSVTIARGVGKNIADFIDPDIDAKLAELEREEEAREAALEAAGDDMVWAALHSHPNCVRVH